MLATATDEMALNLLDLADCRRAPADVEAAVKADLERGLSASAERLDTTARQVGAGQTGGYCAGTSQTIDRAVACGCRLAPEAAGHILLSNDVGRHFTQRNDAGACEAAAEESFPRRCPSQTGALSFLSVLCAV
jgi:hypothetical protein